MKDVKFVVARYEKDGYDNFLKMTIENNDNLLFDTRFVWNDEADGIYAKYNLGIDYHVNKGLKDDDIIVFCHADVNIVDKKFDKKLKSAFELLPTLGVAGVIGSLELTDKCGWWYCNRKHQKGRVIQFNEKSSYYLTKEQGNFASVCVVDGLFMAVRGSLVKKLRFDNNSFPCSYNFYDYDYCLSARELNYTIGVFDILMEHNSIGAGIFQNDWINNKNVFMQKWINKGYSFPIR